jgi:2-methylisocitrate lyase-like PEP mutase family enzyme
MYNGGALDHPMNAVATLRALLARPDAVLAPGAYDALSARIVEAAGFPAVYMTGYGSSAALLGQPDVGLLSMAEMVENARRIAQAVSVPVIADADTGYGNPLNVVRTVRAYEAAGVAGIHIEDQVAPKKCGHMAGKQVIPAEEMEQKLRAAIDARRDPGFLIIARTDARAVNGLEDALERGARYREAGADMLFIEAPESEAEVDAIAGRFLGVPLLYNWAESGRTPPLPLARIEALGYKLVIYPVTALFAAVRAMQRVMTALRRDGDSLAFQDALIGFDAFNAFIGLPAVRDLERRYAVPAS